MVVVAPPTLRLPTLRQRMDVRQEKSGFLNLPHIRLKTALRTLAAHAAAARDLAKREARARRVLQRWQRRQLQAASCSWVHATQAGALDVSFSEEEEEGTPSPGRGRPMSP